MSRFRLCIAGLAMVLVLATQAFASAPTITSISPSSATAGSASFTLTLTGTYLTPSQSVYWNGIVLAPTGTQSAMELHVTVPGTLLAAAATVQIKVYTLAGGYSNSVDFNILALGTSACSTLIATTPSTPPGALPGGSTGTAYYGAILQGKGGASPYTWSVRSYSPGTVFPPGLIMGPTGEISGTPTLAGTYSFVAQVKDSANCVATNTFTISIVAGPLSFTISTTSVPNGNVGAAYSSTLAATGGTSPYTWSVSSGALPPGLTLSTTGAISGTPTTSGSYSFAVQVKDSASQTATHTYSTTIGQ
jgi:hypothetical protein